MFTHLLLPTDGSELSRIAIHQGVQLAQTLKSRITGISVVPEYYLYQAESTLNAREERLLQLRLEAARRLEAIQQSAQENGVACETVCESGDHPYEVIIAAAGTRGCDLIVMASHGRRGISGILLGSETQKVLTHSGIPVLVIR